jgi:hypothetical protein
MHPLTHLRRRNLQAPHGPPAEPPPPPDDDELIIIALLSDGERGWGWGKGS